MDSFINLIENTSQNIDSTNILTLEDQFNAIPNIKPTSELCKEAKRWINDEKNRYTNVLALELTRVKTKSYINANYVFLGNGLMIATQAPLDYTISDFWEMVMYTQADTIFMLTEFIKDGKQKCSEYWPAEGIKKISGGYIENIDVNNELQSVQITKLRCFLNGKYRNVTHIFYRNWTDFSVPDIEEFKSVLDILEKYKTVNPFICHCSAGIGRTGVVAAILRIKNTGETPQRAVEMIRKYRLGMVQTKEQYGFINDFLTSRGCFEETDKTF